jgi:hypothetical protein
MSGKDWLFILFELGLYVFYGCAVVWFFRRLFFSNRNRKAAWKLKDELKLIVLGIPLVGLLGGLVFTPIMIFSGRTEQLPNAFLGFAYLGCIFFAFRFLILVLLWTFKSVLVRRG